MFKRHFVIIGILFSLFFLFMAVLFYPGGSPKNSTSIGYSFTENYISNLLSEKALNGMENKARPWAIIGVLFSSLTFGLFYIEFAKKILLKSVSNVIRYFGIALAVLAFFIVIPSLHDKVVTLSSIMNLIVFFYITIMILKSRLILFKIISVLFMLIFYFACFMYFTQTLLDYLPIMQKLVHVVQIIWILSLHYLTTKKDFEHITK